MVVLEVTLQTLLSFTAILVYTRLLGKQQVGELTFFDYINGITFGSIAAVLATDIGTGKTWIHFLGLTLFATFTLALSRVSLASRAARKIVASEPTVVIHNGRILEQNMSKMSYNLDELTMQLREKGFFNITEVEFALLEANGNLSVRPKSQNRPVTPKDLQLDTSYEGMGVELVMDGEVIYQNLQQNNLDEKWLQQQLEARGVKDLAQVAFASLDSQGIFYLDLVKDGLNHSASDMSDTAWLPPNTSLPGKGDAR